MATVQERANTWSIFTSRDWSEKCEIFQGSSAGSDSTWNAVKGEKKKVGRCRQRKEKARNARYANHIQNLNVKFALNESGTVCFRLIYYTFYMEFLFDNLSPYPIQVMLKVAQVSCTMMLELNRGSKQLCPQRDDPPPPTKFSLSYQVSLLSKVCLKLICFLDRISFWQPHRLSECWKLQKHHVQWC